MFKWENSNSPPKLRKNEQVVLVFYYGYQCPPCMAQLKEIENDHAKYEESGTQVIAIAVQDEREAKLSAEKSGAHFPILADDNGAIAEAYGVEDNGWSTPSVFVIGQDGSILWQEITNMESYQGCGIDRVSSQTILENLS